MAQLNAPEYAPFEKLKHRDEFGNEYWLARELAPVLEYEEWRNFQKAIERAILACDHSNMPVQDHFVEANRMIELGDDAYFGTRAAGIARRSGARAPRNVERFRRSSNRRN